MIKESLHTKSIIESEGINYDQPYNYLLADRSGDVPFLPNKEVKDVN